MRAELAGRLSGACLASVAAAALFLGATAAPALAHHPLVPDLVTQPFTQKDLFLDQFGKGKDRVSVLRLTNEVGNRGDGPLEIEASGASENCDGDSDPDNDRIASQRIFGDFDEDGEFERGIDTSYETSEIGCLRYHPAHSHWHVLDFAKYTLISEETGVPAEGTKVGFCLGDSSNPFTSIGPNQKFYSFSDCGGDGVPPEFMGISVGWADIYGYTTPGQRIRVTGLNRGRYCLRSEADPVGNLIELNDANNATELRIRMNLERGKVTALSGACQLG